MTFTSLLFWSFFAVVFVVYWLLRRRGAQNLVLLLASYVFYGWFSPWYALLLGISTLADFFLARRLHQRREQAKLYLTLSLILNIGVLAFFKYYNFFNTQVAESLTSAGLPVDWLFVNLFLPAGLSFYTLKKLAYMIDVSRGTLEPSRDLVVFALFVSFFPQIVAGPIDRYQKLAPQIEQERAWQPDFFYTAWPLLVTGFFKKIVIADTLKAAVDRIFALSDPSIVLLIAGAVGFTLEILADFSAYTDLSRGIARLLGFSTSENFNKPYLARTPTEFWNRWHITLSTWLRDYIFFPVRRFLLRRGTSVPVWLGMSIPPLITMSISGIWHGAGSTFLVWGLYYGILIAVYQLSGLGGDWSPRRRLNSLLAWLVMFCLIAFGWLIFRAPSLAWLVDALRQAEWSRSPSDWIVALTVLSMTAAYSLPLLIKHLLDRYVPSGLVHSTYYAALTLGTVIFTSSVTSDFIYFQF